MMFTVQRIVRFKHFSCHKPHTVTQLHSTAFWLYDMQVKWEFSWTAWRKNNGIAILQNVIT